jgi:hypothetical protein
MGEEMTDAERAFYVERIMTKWREKQREDYEVLKYSGMSLM